MPLASSDRLVPWLCCESKLLSCLTVCFEDSSWHCLGRPQKVPVPRLEPSHTHNSFGRGGCDYNSIPTQPFWYIKDLEAGCRHSETSRKTNSCACAIKDIVIWSVDCLFVALIVEIELRPKLWDERRFHSPTPAGVESRLKGGLSAVRL